MRLPVNYVIPEGDRVDIRAAREGAAVVVQEIDVALEALKGEMDRLRRQRRNFLIFRRTLDLNRIRDGYQLYSAINLCCSIFSLSMIVSCAGWRKEIPAVFQGADRDRLLTRVVELSSKT